MRRKVGVGLTFNFTKFDKILLLAFIMVATAGLGALLNERLILSYMNEGSFSEQENIGKVLSITNIVKQKSHSATHWRNTSQGGNIANGEMLYTDDDSVAEVMIGESKFSLSPRSLIVFRKEGKNDHLELLSGEVRGKFKNITVVAEGKKMRVNTQNSVFKVSKNKKIVVEHKDKAAKVHAPLTSLTDIKELNPIELRLGQLAKSFFLVGSDQTAKIPLQWITNAASAEVKISRLEGEGQLRTVLNPTNSKEGRYIATVDRPGKYLVKISPSDSDFVVEREFEVIHVPLPKIKKPLIEVEL